MHSDKLGFLNVAGEIVFSGGRIAPLVDFGEAKEWVDKYSHRDGFLYPPQSHLADEEGEPRPNAQRPALLYHLPVSHELSLDCCADAAHARRGAAGFLLHLLAYLYGVRLQFHDWWVDSRIPIKSLHNVILGPKTAPAFLGHALNEWQRWPSEEQKRFTNALYLHSRSLCYEWDWEQFSVEYMVTDASYATGLALRHFRPAKGHGDRIRSMCDAYGLCRNDGIVNQFVTLRNSLVHETLWDGGRPCEGASPSAFMASRHLHRFNQRLLAAVLHTGNRYVGTNWAAFGSVSFDMPA